MRPRIGIRIKKGVESTLGLNLGDAVNVAIFILTIISLVVAFVGVWYAKRTLSDARTSAKSQEDALAAQVTAMRSVNDSLTTLLVEVSNQKKLADASLQELKDQNQRAKDIESRHPDARVALRCSKPVASQPGLLTYVDSFSFRSDREQSDLVSSANGSWKFVRPTAEVVISKTLESPDADLQCVIEISNNGRAPMTKARLSLSATITDRHGDSDYSVPSIPLLFSAEAHTFVDSLEAPSGRGRASTLHIQAAKMVYRYGADT